MACTHLAHAAAVDDLPQVADHGALLKDDLIPDGHLELELLQPDRLCACARAHVSVCVCV